MTQRMLIVDDEPAIRKAFSEMLFTETSIEVIVAASGEEAAGMTDRNPGVIIADYQLGAGMNGVTFLQQARARMPLASRYLYTNNLGAAIEDMAGRDETVGEEGLALLAMDKDASVDYLHDTVRAGFERHEQLAASIVLAVDDEPSLLRILNRRFSMKGYTIETRTDPQQAIAHLQAYTQSPEHKTKPIAVLLTDTNMPNANGSDVARAAKAADPNIRVVMMTGERSLNRGMYTQLEKDIGPFPIIDKPFDFNAMYACIGKEIVRYHAGR